MYYYVYLIKFNTGQFYIGSRKSKVTPEDDTKYWGSPVTYKHLWEDVTLEKTKHILKVCPTFDEMSNLEIKLIKEAWNKYPDECLNRHASPVFHPEIVRRTANSRRKEFTLKSPTGEIVKAKGINKFCKENNLDFGTMCKVLSGKQVTHKGWSLPIDIKERKIVGSKSRADKLSKKFTIMSPNGEVVIAKNISKFCKENNLDAAEISKVISHKALSHKGWKLPETKLVMASEAAANKLSKEFILKSPTGEIVKGKGINKFCKENNLNTSAVCLLLSGKAKTHKGWTKP